MTFWLLVDRGSLPGAVVSQFSIRGLHGSSTRPGCAVARDAPLVVLVIVLLLAGFIGISGVSEAIARCGTSLEIDREDRDRRHGGRLCGRLQRAALGRMAGLPAGLFALPMSESDLEIFRACTGRQTPSVSAVREAWMVVGRRGGKSRIAAFLAVFCACFRRYALAPGERGVVMVIAADRRQARVVMRYVVGLLEAIP